MVEAGKAERETAVEKKGKGEDLTDGCGWGRWRGRDPERGRGIYFIFTDLGS
jgi:hypothetical protein